MSTTSSLNQYWLERGQHYRENDGYRLSKPFHVEQAQFFADTIARMEPGTILEVGCGYGRVTRVIAERLPRTPILGTDLVPAQLREAIGYCDGLSNTEFAHWDISNEMPQQVTSWPPWRIGGRGSCIVLASEVLIHVPPSDLSSVVERLMSVGKSLVHDFDPNVEPGSGNGPHCWNHDFAEIYSAMGIGFRIQRRGKLALLVTL